MATTSNNNRKRLSHYVPVALAELFDETADKFPMLTKQGLFQIVIRAGIKAVLDNEQNPQFFHDAFQDMIGERAEPEEINE